MAVLSNTGILAGSSGGEPEDPPYEVSHSLRLSREDGAYLHKTFSGGDRNKGTISFWVKRGSNIGSHMTILTCWTGATNSNAYFDIGFATYGDSDELEFRDYGTGNSTFYHTGHSYRDPAAWMHICVNWNSELEDSMEEDRLTVWINGEQKDKSTFRYHEKWDGKDEDCEMFRGSSVMQVGRRNSSLTRYGDAYVAEVIGISGLQTTPDIFAEYNSDGVWVPREVVDNDNNNEIKLRTPNTDAGSPTWSTSHTSISGNRSGSGTGSYAWNMVFNGNWIADTSGYEQGCLPATNADPWVPQHVTWTGSDQIITWKNRMRMLIGFDDRGEDGIYVDVTTSSEGLQRFQGSGAGHISTSGNKYWAVVSEQPGTLEKVTHVMNAGGNTAVIWAIEVDGVVLKDDHTDATHHDPHSDSWYLKFDDSSNLGKDTFNATNFTNVNLTNSSSDENGGTLIQKTTGTYMGGHSGSGWSSTPPASGTNNTLLGTGRESVVYEFTPTIEGNGDIQCRQYSDGASTGAAKMRGYDGSSWGSWIDIDGGSGYAWQNRSLGVDDLQKFEIDYTGGGHDPHIAGFFLNGGTSNSDWWQFLRYSKGNSDQTVESPTNYGTDTGLGGEVRGNYCVLNSMQTEKAQSGTFSNSNLKFTAPGGGSGYPTVAGTMGVSTGKWYWEVWLDNLPANNYHGITKNSLFSLDLSVADTYPGKSENCYVVRTDNGKKYTNNADSSYGDAYAGGDTLQVALDLDNGKIWFGKNNVWPNSGNPATGANEAYSGLQTAGTGDYIPVFSSYNQGAFIANFGARPFKYQAPSGFKCLCSTNLPTTVKEKKGFESRLIRGNMDAKGWSFGPDFIWIKRRDTSNGFTLFDKIRGTTSRLDCQGTAAAETTSTAVTAFNDDGFTTGSNVNVGGDSVVAWCWEGGASITPSDSYDITPSAQYLNAAAGFSMTKWTGTGTASDKVPHALGITPGFVLSKSIDAVGHWQVKHRDAGNNAGLLMDSDSAADSSPTNGNLDEPSSDTFGFNNGSSTCDNVNESGTEYITYCWADIAGFSKFGYYVGNASAAGPFCYTGFRPGVLIIKSVDSRGWAIQDTARSPHNTIKYTLFPSADSGEYTSTGSSNHLVDFLSNGFRIRNTNTRFNTSAEKYLFMAWAEAPLKTARAR